MKLVDSKYLKKKKRLKPKKIKIKPFIIMFGIVLMLYLFYWVYNNFEITDNPNLDFLPDNIKNNNFFGNLHNNRSIEIIPTISSFAAHNEDDLLIKYTAVK
jgi:hypothetical protein